MITMLVKKMANTMVRLSLWFPKKSIKIAEKQSFKLGKDKVR